MTTTHDIGVEIAQAIETSLKPPGETCQDCGRREAIGLYVPEKYKWCNYAPDGMSLSELVARCQPCAHIIEQERQRQKARQQQQRPWSWMGGTGPDPLTPPV